ncbi:MAG: substrate-binding domain-containing protein [Prevotellaceae bacterium]|jgi:phosphate transport system substrate-binding protein|nr:substrate-binding domain-containing protein [Prevotellaceae bacterium]
MLKKLSFTLVCAALLCACQNKPKNTENYAWGFITITTDESFTPIIDTQIMVFESIYPNANIHLIDTTEVAAIDMLVKDSVRLTIATRRLHEHEKAQLKEKKLFAQETKIALDAIALIINPENNDSLMSISTFREILNGSITKWQDINPNSKLGDIRVVFDNPRSSTVRYAVDSILRGGSKLAANVYAQENNAEVVEFVSRNPSSIGVIGVNWIENPNDTTNLSFNDRVRVMAMSNYANATPDNSFKPFQAYIVGFSDENGGWNKYPMTREVYMLNTDPGMKLPTGFVNFVASDRGQRIILKSGLVPAIVNQIRLISVKE